jgi:diphthine-ammonia ligase
VILVSRVAFLSGGKDSFYAATKYWPPDFGLFLVYDFPIPSPHIVNLGKSVETLLLAGIPVVVVKLNKNKERSETIHVLRKLKATEIIAGDVYIEDHLKYMSEIAAGAGAKLREPLWGLGPEELLREMMDQGFEALITGVKSCIKHWIGKILNKATVEDFVKDTRKCGYDPLGERGEYHTLITRTPYHKYALTYEVLSIETKHKESEDYYILKLS